ncbi:bifunctional enzyme involved in thiolation and methylation of tRNA [Buchnera aphidicola (Cinara tujafilina)]|uniref:tRNA-2-methylthio-N(6)-dimethylallyladenosine synthase n=1 Tax=Buchnera aphidicola (Cinara tujafilina) TaxID=261317 RepID=F7WZJ4_9GAMM|nr:tRNA (N6-isopentenyl adenosine(37)-C2)-methylthiotransferase MiaB [Buchnera aphidicola]AEH39861.1 bifunctional enzyme involved in thiolation and methylation of tRNA [Buchnera aphidicola (Cinara tujafilina)]
MTIKKTKKIYIKTWGCQMNQHDSDILINIFNKTKKYKIVKTPENSNILILNTCSIREKAQEKLFHQLGRWKKLKDKNSNIIIAVGGCVAAQEGKKIYQRANYINIIFGPKTVHKLPELIKKISHSNICIIDIDDSPLKKFNSFCPQFNSVKKVSSFVTIIEGCNKFCSFCIVPYTRGREISRPYVDIIREIKELSNLGVCEVILLGQNVNSYYYKKNNQSPCSFSDLLHLISDIPKIQRIRYITSHPKDFSDDIINAYKTIPKLMDALHLPVQCGSNKILKLMKRGYTTHEYENIIKKIRKIRPNISISSDFIVGFPGETKKDFNKTLDFIKKIDFDSSYSFIYSVRPGTRAAKLIDNVPLKEKKENLLKLQKKLINMLFNGAEECLEQYNQYWLKKIHNKNNHKVLGRTKNNKIVCLHGTNELIGHVVNVKITNINYHSFLRGEIIL